MSTYREIKMEFDGVTFNTNLNDTEFEILQKEVEGMNEYLKQDEATPDWTIQKAIASAILEGIKAFQKEQKRKQETKEAADEGTPDSQETKILLNL